MLTLRHLYSLWLILQVTALAFSGWFSRIQIYKGASWGEVLGYSSQIWPITSLSLSSYDITEFLFYYAILPFLIYRFLDRYFIFEKHS